MVAPKSLSVLTLITLGLIMCMTTLSAGQGCSGDVFLSTQEEVDAFSCAEVTGRLVVSGEQITNLEPLSVLVRAGGLEIRNTNAISTGNFTSLTEVQGALIVAGNSALTEIGGFASLTIQTGGVYIQNNNSLIAISGFTSLATIANGSLSISNNASLTSIDGFVALASIAGSSAKPGETLPSGLGLSIVNNESLVDINGFASLGQISSEDRSFLIITDNHALTNINGLSHLTTITGVFGVIQFIIEGNTALKNLDGLSSLDHFYGRSTASFRIANNAALEDIDGLSNFRPFYQTTIYFTVTENQSLVKCDGLSPYFASLGWETAIRHANAGTINFNNNGSGCSFDDLVMAATQAVKRFRVVNTQNGQVFADFTDASVVIDRSLPASDHLGIEAITLPATVGSVHFVFTNRSVFPNKAYTLTTNSSPYVFTLPLDLIDGSYTILADIYSGPDETGDKSTGINEAYVTIINSPKVPSVVSFDVVDLHGNVLMPLVAGAKINLKDPMFKKFSIRANTAPENTGRVRFFLNDVFIRIENVPPYALNGDVNGSYNAWNPQPGSYTLSATPSLITNGTEIFGSPYAVQFTLTEEDILKVIGFDVVDRSGTVLKALSEGDEINIRDPRYHAINIVARTTSDVRSVKFIMNDQFVRIENVEPFAVAGDQNGHFYVLPLSAGRYKLKAIPYAQVQGAGPAGKLKVIHFSIVEQDPIAVSGFELVDTSGKLIRHLTNNDVIDLSDPATTNVSIIAKTRGPVGSVQFSLNGVVVRNENVVPYSLLGDYSGLFNAWHPQPGTYILSAKPYAVRDATGRSGESGTITLYVDALNGSEHFSSMENGNGLKVELFPVPVENELSVRCDDNLFSNATLTIVTAQGVQVYSKPYHASTAVSTGNLKPGVYYLQLLNENGLLRWAKFIKK